MIQLSKVLNIKEGEGKPTALLFGYFFFFGATLTVGKTARDAYFLSRFDITYLPLMFLVAAGAVAVLATINYVASKRLDLTRHLFRSTILSGFFFAISLISIQNNLNGLMIPFLYVWIDVITIVINFQFVIHAGMVFNARQAKRLFGIILCGSPIARILIGAGLHPFVGQFGSGYLLTLAAGFILCCVFMAWLTRPYIHPGTSARQSRPEASKNNGSLGGYLKMLALATGATAAATVIIEYQFLIFSNHAFPSEESLTVFFGTFYSATGFISLFTQLFLTRWVLTRFGILSAMRILPAGLGIGALAILFNPSLFSAMIGRASEQITKFTLNKTSFELLWIPVSPDQKQRKKLFIDDSIKAGVQGLSGVLIYALIKVWPIPYPALMQVLSLGALVAIGVWFFTTSRLKNGYVSALVYAIEKRRLDFKQMRIDAADSTIVNALEDALHSGEEAKQIFVLELISSLPIAPWLDTLRRLFKTGGPSVRAKILAMAGDNPDILSNEDIRSTIEAQGELAGDAIILSGKRNMMEMAPLLTHLLETTHHQKAGLRAAAATALLMMNIDTFGAARSTLEELLYNDDEELKTIALRMLHHIPDFPTDTQLRECCLSDSIHVCSAALDIAHHRYQESLIPGFIHCLKHPQTRAVSRKALEAYPPGDVAVILDEMLLQDEIETEHKIEIIRTIKEYPDSQSISILVQLVKHPSLHIQTESIDALLDIAKQTPLPADILRRMNDESTAIAKQIYSRYTLMGLIARKSDGLLLTDLYAHEIERYLPMLIKLLVLPVPEIPIEAYIRNGKYEYGVQADNLVEVFDTILPRKVSGYVIPLLRDMPVDDRRRIGHSHFPDLPKELDAELLRLMRSSNDYHRIIGLDYAIRHGRLNALAQIDWTAYADRKMHFDVIEKHLASHHDGLMNLPEFPRHRFQNTTKETQMLTVLEKTIILKGTNLFEGVPGEEIYHVAQVMEEERLEKGCRLFERGDKGDFFYVIVNGEILIHIGERELSRHVNGEYFGEMALLDDSPRSSSATAAEETLLLKISRDNFLDIMMHHKEVRRSIMKIINERFRRLTDQYAKATS